MKKICFFSGDITRSGGTERVAAMIANGLQQTGRYEILFLSLVEKNKEPFFALDPAISRYVLGEKWINPGPGYMKLLPKIRRFIRQQKVDIIVDIDIVLDVLSIPACRGRNVRIVSWDHFNFDFEMSLIYRRMILKYSVKHTDRIVTLTKENEEAYRRQLRRTKNITTIYNPMEEKKYVPEQTQKEKYVITVGRLVEEKGIDYLAVVASRVLEKYPDWKWLVLGEGDMRQLLEKTIKEKHLEGRLILTGNVQDVGAYLAKSQIFVLTSRREGLPMCLLEAKAYDLACISFDISTGPKEIIKDGRNGYLIPPFDWDGMAEKIGWLIEHDEVRNLFCHRAKEDTQEFEFGKIIEKWEREVLTE